LIFIYLSTIADLFI